MQANLKVERTQAQNFSKVWTLNGVSVPLSDVTIQFATDFANVVLAGFVALCAQRSKAAKAAAEEP